MKELNRQLISRRTALGGALGLSGLAVLKVHIASAQGTPVTDMPDGVQPDGSWSFTDDRGVAIALPEVPATIVAQTTAAASLYDFGVQIAGIYGPSKTADGEPDFQAGNLPLDSIAILGDWGAEALELDIEKLIEVDPDLIVDMLVYEDTLWYLSGDSRELVEQRKIPIAAINMGQVSLLAIIERMQDLAVALGADLAAPQVADAKTLHQAAEDRLKAAIAAKPDLTVMVMSAGVEQAWIASPRYMNDLMYFQELGLHIVDHDLDDWFKEISWEEIGNYPADVILQDARNTSTLQELSSTIPILGTLPAVKAGQTGWWYAGAPSSYGRLAPIMDELSGVIESAEAGIA